MSEFTVTYERKLSDHNYGSESFSMSCTWKDDFEESNLELAAQDLRRVVLGQLAKSAAEAVRWEAERELHPPERIAVPIDSGVTDVEDLPF